MPYKTIVTLVQSIIQAIENGFTSLGRIYNDIPNKQLQVKVLNPQTEVKVTGKVEVDQKDTQDGLKNNALAIRELKATLLKLKEIKVLNFPTPKEFPKFPEFPKKIEVSNLLKEMKVTNMRELIDSVQSLHESIEKLEMSPKVNIEAPIVNIPAPIVNIPDVKPPVVNVEPPDLSSITKLLEFLNTLSSKKPLPVQLSDGSKFYKALEKMGDIYTANGGSGSSFQNPDGDMGSAGTDEYSALKTVKPNYKKRIVKDGSITYIATAVRGTAYSEAKWLVQRIDETDSDDVVITWASDRFDQIITDIENLDYE